jgi:hypothetical protein
MALSTRLLAFVLIAGASQLFSACNDGGLAVDEPVTPATTGRIAGHIVDDAGQPIAQARVNATSPTATSRQAIAGDDGSFVFNALPAGEWTVRPDPRQYAADSVVVAVNAGATLTTPPIASRLISGDVRGFVQLNDGHPGANVLLRVMRDGQVVSYSNSQATGAFLLPFVPLGLQDIEVIAAHPDYRRERVTVDVRAREQQVPVITLVRTAGSVRGRLRYEGSGAPVLSATVVLTSEQRTLSAVTDLEGVYSFDHVPFGAWSLSVGSSSWLAAKSVGVEVASALFAVPDLDVGFRLAPGARLVVYDSCEGDGNPYFCDARPGIRIADESGNTGQLAFTDMDAYNVAWAPSRQIAFIHNGSLVTMEPDGAGMKTLFAYGNPGDARAPAWSPDGSKLAFTMGGSRFTRLYVVNADGSDLRALTPEGSLSTSTWSPDGQRIAFDDCSNGICDIRAIDVTGNNRVRLSNSAATGDSYHQPSWSPDGAKILLVVCRNGCTLGLLDVSSGGVTKWSVSGSCPVWSPDGTQFAVVNSRNIDIFTANGQPVRSIYAPTLFSCRVAWSPQ